MKQTTHALIVALLAGCAAQTGPTVDDAIADFITSSELEEMDLIRTWDQYGTSDLTERYIILRTRKDVYLVRFDRPCPELHEFKVTADIQIGRAHV